MRPKIILDTRKILTTGPDAGRYHMKIKVRIPVFENGSKVWKPKSAKTGVFATQAEFEAMPDSRSKNLQEKWDKVNEWLKKGKQVCKVHGLTPEMYIQMMEGAGNFESVTGMFDYYIGECLKENEEGEARDGNAMALLAAKRFFIRYKGGDHISYAEITPAWLENCKRWALNDQLDDKQVVIKKAISLTSFYIYCRALRSIMNMAHEPFNKISKESIPFGKGKGKFKIPGSSKKKRKIKLDLATDKLIEQKNKILSFVSEFPGMNKYLNYWKASYFGNGSNMADVLRWKVGEYDKAIELITFERKKTENTQEGEEVITIAVGDELREVIAREGNKSLDPDQYIFPVLRKGMSSAERKKAVKDFIRCMNRSLARAGKLMGLEIKLTSSSSRYLMSTLLDRSGIPKSVIKEILGHETEAMQGHYVSPHLADLRKTIAKILAG